MAEFLLSKRAVTVYEVLFILVLLVVLIVQSRKKKAQEERRKISSRKSRNTELEEKLRNPDVRQEKVKDPRPFDVQYSSEVAPGQERLPDLQVEIEVHSQTSVRKYLFDLNQAVTIGRDDGNVLPVKDASAAPRNCTIFGKNRAVFVNNQCASDPVRVQRGKKSTQVNRQAVKLENRDILFFGNMELHITIHKNKK